MTGDGVTLLVIYDAAEENVKEFKSVNGGVELEIPPFAVLKIVTL